VADETAAKEAVGTALMAAQTEYADLERTAVSAMPTASFAAVSSATLCLNSDQRNQDQLRKSKIQLQRNFEYLPTMLFFASSL